MTGFINVIKPKGMSSARVVTAVKKKFHTPCGHMGTLDPMASGVLPIGIGKTSRLFQYMLDKEKEYIATFKFGILTDTLDTTGEVEQTSNVIPSVEEIQNAVKAFEGDILQVPPKYSAKCIDGKRGYQLARSGVEFTLAPKQITVYSFKLNKQVSPDEFEFTIRCGGGTYIRSLARDLGYQLNTLCVMSGLVRSQSGIFNIENGVMLEEFEKTDTPEKYIIPADQSVSFDKLVLTEVQAQKILDGVYENYGFTDGTYRVYKQTDFIGVGVVSEGILRIKSYVR